MRRLMLALALMASAPAPAAACHRYSTWLYPWPQRCSVHFIKAHQSSSKLSREKSAIELPTDLDIPLPTLDRADCVGGEADENTRARLMLRATLSNHPSFQ